VGFFMSIELTALEKSTQKKRENLEQAMKDWRKQLSQEIANKKITKKNISNKEKVKKEKSKARHSANRLINSFEKGWTF